MVFNWLSGQFGEATVTDLIARKRYSRAIEVLKEQISKRPPSVQTRLQLADVLVLAGRGREAIPYFLQIADELANDGFSARAVAIFKKVEKLEPGRPDVSLKLQALATLGRTLVAPETQHQSPSPGGDGSDFMRLVDFGIEEVGAVTWRRIQQQREEKEKAEQSPGEAEWPEPSVLADPACGSNPAGISAGVSEPVPAFPVAGEISPAAVEAMPEVAVTSVETEASVETTATLDAAPLPVPQAPESPSTPSEPQLEPGAPKIEPPRLYSTGLLDPAESSSEPADAEAPVLAPESTPTTAAPIVDSDQVVPVAAEPGVASSGGAVPTVSDPGPSPSEILTPQVSESEEPELAAVMIDPADVIFDPPADAKQEAEPAAPASPIQDAHESDAPLLTTAPATFVPDGEHGGSPEMAQSVFDDQVLDVIEALVATPPKTETRSEESPASQPVPVPRHNVLLASLTDEDAFSLLQRMRLVSLMPGDVVLTEGERSDGLFILAAGRAKVFVQGAGQRNLPIGFLREGDFFGEAPSITGRPRSATVVCAEPCW
jgi:hypothetical protein